MQIIESYVHEVARYLPEDQRSEVVADLMASLCEELDERVAEQGREPRVQDELDVLAGFGHPLKVANQYLPPRFLIGPELYPIFVQALKILLCIALGGLVVVGLILALVSDWRISPWSLFWATVGVVVWVTVVLLGVFIALEASGERVRWYDNWTPKAIGDSTLGIVDRGDIISNLLTSGFFLLWWNDVLVWPDIVGALDTYALELGSVWEVYFWHLNVVVGGSFLLHFYLLVVGLWARLTLVTDIVLNTALLAIVAVLVSSGLIELQGTLPPEVPVDILQQILRVSLLVLMGFIVWDIVKAFLLLRGKHR